MSDIINITQLSNVAQQHDERLAAGYILSRLSREELDTYVTSQSFSKRQVISLLEKATDEYLIDALARVALKQSPTFNQLCKILYRSSSHYTEVVRQITTRFPNPTTKQLDLLIPHFTAYMLFDFSAESRAEKEPLARYILANTNSPNHLMTLYGLTPELDESILESLQRYDRIEVDVLRSALIRYFPTEESRLKIARVVASMSNLPKEIVAILASHLYGFEDCWQQFKGDPNLTLDDLHPLLFPLEVTSFSVTTEPCASPPAYFDEVLHHYYRLQPDSSYLAVLLFRYPTHSEAITRQLVARMPRQHLLQQIFAGQAFERTLPASVCDLLGEYAVQQKRLSDQNLCYVAAFAPSVADRAYIRLLTHSPSESDFKGLIRLNGYKKADAAIALLKQYPTEDNAVFVAEYVPELALFALEQIEHSAYEVLTSLQDESLPDCDCEEFY